MVQPCSVADREQVVDTMIALTRLSSLHRAIVAGTDSMELMGFRIEAGVRCHDGLVLSAYRQGFCKGFGQASAQVEQAA